MRKLFIWLLVCAGWLASCEDVIEVDLPEGDTRLIVDGLIRVDTTEAFIPVSIKVSESTGFFDEIPATSLESISIIYEQIEDGTVVFTGTSSLAELNPGSGVYEPDPNFSSDQRIPTSVLQRENLRFTLLMRHKGRQYLAQTFYVPTVPIDNLEQGTGTLFEGDETEVVVSFTDNPDRDDFYLFDFGFDEFLTSEDEFFQGQQFAFSYFYDQEFDPGTILEISIMGADREFFNYMDLILEQTEQSVGFFETPRATVRGNVIDITDLDNVSVTDNTSQPKVFPLGYFAVVQEFRDTLVIE
ncbi:DUF4249 family protein [Lentiprolixibacter aurantiacus]|uniref:DUF4249 domain-containing protein n=1 Tax=Lentiprolixibacter aurantiacus TaxID=2993939 RepID=A0AAE3MNE5_9FLAO|nr:DUF4249 family protein [Lentiprolixibacter aurantiacus]MCX2720067.1 DUF4249 domain-containing protein [Lentiprolixibacter aurantiacus]